MRFELNITLFSASVLINNKKAIYVDFNNIDGPTKFYRGKTSRFKKYNGRFKN